jgi:uncharacterized SAM-binding protein YcdF (DUF218 family)
MNFLVLGLLVGIILLLADASLRWFADAWLIALGALYWLLSTPAIAQALIKRLQSRYGTIHTMADAREARVIVAVGNGSVSYTDGRYRVDVLTRRSTFCVFEVARLYALLQPDRIIVSGGAPSIGARPESELMRDQLMTFNVPPERLVLESTSHTTEEQAAQVAQLLNDDGHVAPTVVVTTAAHMPRVMKLFRARGIDAVPSVTPELRYDEGRTGWRRWVPSASALRGSETVMYECLAQAHAIASLRSL